MVFFSICFCGSCSVDFLFSEATLNGHSRDFVVPLLLTPHLHMEVHVQVLAQAIGIFVVFRCYQDPHQVQ